MLSPGGRCFTFNVQFSVTVLYSEHSFPWVEKVKDTTPQKLENRFVDLFETTT